MRRNTQCSFKQKSILRVYSTFTVNNIIYNSIPYGLLKEKSQIDRLGVSSLRLAFTIEKPQDAVKIYEEFRAVYRDGKNPPKREYTKGHFKRGAE